MIAVSRQQAVMVAARELRLQRCKVDVWETAETVARRRGSSCRLEYARLRYRELTSGTRLFGNQEQTLQAVEDGLHRRSLRALWEGGVFLLAVVALLVVSLHGVG